MPYAATANDAIAGTPEASPTTTNPGWKPYQIAGAEYRLAKLLPHFHPDAVSQALETCLREVPVEAGLDGLVAAVRERLEQRWFRHGPALAERP